MPDNEREKILRIFQYLKELDELRNPAVRHLKDHPLHLMLDGLPSHPAIQRPAAGGEDAAEVLRITAAEQVCPPPPTGLEVWLKPGWQDAAVTAEILDEREEEREGGIVHRVFFTDDPERSPSWESWRQQRATWIESETAVRELRKRLGHVLGEMDKEGEEFDLLLGTAILKDEGQGILHPMLLQRAALTFLPDQTTYVLRVTDEPPQLHQPLLRLLPALDAPSLAALESAWRERAPDLANRAEAAAAVAVLAKVMGAPLDAGEVLMLRRRTLGYQRAVSRVLQDIEAGGPLPVALTRIAGLSDDLPAVPSTSQDDSRLLLTKAANDEQMRIVRRLERNNAVLVQGPPGTGKTHSIANLIGHLLADGKRVLVTAHTSKALRVLRDMVPEALRPLCLTVLDSDADNHALLNQAVQGITAKLSASDAEVLQREAEAIDTRRRALIVELQRFTAAMSEAQLLESKAVPAAGATLSPMEAARLHREGVAVHDWIPGPITPAVPSPLTPLEASFLYESNALLTAADEADLEGTLPDTDKLMGASELAMLMSEHARFHASATYDRPELWTATEPPVTMEQLDALQPRISAAANTIRSASGWWMEVVRAGRQGGVTRQVWEELAAQIEQVAAKADALAPSTVRHDPQILPAQGDDTAGDEVALLTAIAQHLRGGGSLGLWTRTTKRPWHRLIDRCRIDGRPPETLEHMETLLALAELTVAREAMRSRWQRQVTAAGGPDASTLGAQPEKTALPIVQDVRDRLDWHDTQWLPLHRELTDVGFQWDTYASGLVLERNEFGDLARFRSAVSSGLAEAVRARRDGLRLATVQAQFSALQGRLTGDTSSPVTRRLLAALADHDALAYAGITRDVQRLTTLKAAAAKRRELLAKLEADAPAWAAALRSRTAPHDAKKAPGDAAEAWRWKQIADALQHRAQPDLNTLQSAMDALRSEITELTAQLAEKRAWASMKQGVTSQQQAALEGYVGCLQKMTKSGRGRRDAALMAAARGHLKTALKAVPVWIMPLSRVYESFYSDDALARFDAVIVDEASQSDVSALTAIYLGEKAVIVGDEEQVTPTPFADLDRVQKMISTGLEGVPNRELYDPETSVYHLARAFFKERILLREHFRSVPEIIAFSNALSYEGGILPLREAAGSTLHPALLAHRVKGSVNQRKVNMEEAEEIAALIMACLEQPEYDLNEAGAPASFGVVSLLGDEQADCIEALLRSRLSPQEFERRRLVCGNAAQFQGDERDVMFLSLVDASGASVLPLRGFGPKEIFRKRFNVAASRARNQMWVVHSLDPQVDLQPEDLRRRLIEHCITAPQQAAPTTQSTGATPLHRDVRTWLAARGYQAFPQWPVGTCVVDLAVRQGGRYVAIRCEGGRELSDDEARQAMEKQTLLQRLGWPFVHVRASAFYRDEEAAMRPVVEALESAGIRAAAAAPTKAATGPDLITRVLKRVPEIRWAWAQRQRPKAPEPAAPAPPEAAKPAPTHVAAPDPTSCTVEVGDWVEFVLAQAPGEPQYVNIVAGPTDVELSTINEREPLAGALLGRAVHDKSAFTLGTTSSEIEILQIHKPRKHPTK